ncbi:MAG TPA: helix-hairpin-helix domain-containing protein [Kofleriaceae bacterium]|nr:helix-hairpin-helix domain-containing protein [Kofleriaceae bacterium]
MDLATIDLFGHWVGIFLTFCILSFLYKDNPFYKLAEHLFIGVSVGYIVTQQYYNVLEPKVVQAIASADHWYFNLALVPLVLVALLFVRSVSKRYAWIGRYPLAFVVALYAGIQINAVAQADLGQQMKRAMSDVVVDRTNVNTASAKVIQNMPGMSPDVAQKIVAHRDQQPFSSLDDLAGLDTLTADQRATLDEGRGHVTGLDARLAVTDGQIDWFGTLSRIFMVLGLIASLVYFYFSIAHKGAIGGVSRFGVWVLMIGFGASFGFTVQGRIALAIGRSMDILGLDKAPAVAEQIHGPLAALVVVAIIVFGLAVWELRSRRAR